VNHPGQHRIGAITSPPVACRKNCNASIH
jgi:hypothetical protein